MGFESLTVYTDGASRGNPGEAGIGLAFFDASGAQVHSVYRYIGQATNNVAEYTALITALEEARRMGAHRVAVFSDSELMVRQMNGEYKVKNEALQPLFHKAGSLSAGFAGVTFTHVTRDRNRVADKLANKAIDEKKIE